ncbi:MAG TPA: DEAD/DEAH box helicase, partial [Caulobacteraceae bacterium]
EKPKDEPQPKPEAKPEVKAAEEPPIRPVRGVSKPAPRDADDSRVVGFGDDVPAFLARATPGVSSKSASD